MAPALEQLLTWLSVAGFGVVMVAGWRSLSRKFRRLVLPMVVRENWTDEEYARYAERQRQFDKPQAGSLVWQMHMELEQLTTNAVGIADSLKNWRGQLNELEKQQAQCAENAGQATHQGRHAAARQLLADRGTFEAHGQEIRHDITRLEALLATYRSDIGKLEAKLADTLRRSSVADARLTAARNSVRARQLVYGTLAEAALNRLEKAERAADLAEGAAEALALGSIRAIDRDFAELERDAALESARDRIAARSAARFATTPQEARIAVGRTGNAKPA